MTTWPSSPLSDAINENLDTRERVTAARRDWVAGSEMTAEQLLEQQRRLKAEMYARRERGGTE